MKKLIKACQIMKIDKIKVSIIIPVYNVAPYVKRCLDSVFAQTYKNIEILIIDDCGTDNSIEIVKDLTLKEKIENDIRIIHHPHNKGLSVARNTGIKESTGDFLYFLDSDDEITPECIELLLNETLTQTPDFVIADYNCIGNNVPMPPLSINRKTISGSSEILKLFREQKWYVMAVNKLIRKSFIISNELFFKENIIHEDILWSFLLACNATVIKVIKDKTYNYYIREDSITESIKVQNNNQFKHRSNESKRVIVSSMYTYLIESEQKDKNKDINKTFEEYKYLLFISIIKNNTYTKDELFFIYKEFGRLKNTTNLRIFLLNCVDIKTFIKFFHYLLPSYFGYRYIIGLEKLNKKRNTIFK